jgi:hypothetical protein
MNLNQIKLNYHGHVKDGLLKFAGRKQFDKDILIFEGKDVEIIIQKKRKQRSEQQSRYYWGAVIPIIKAGLFEAGIVMNSEQVHELLKSECNKKEWANIKTGQLITAPGSTAKLTTSEFMDFIVRVKNWANEFLNITIPEPGELTQIEFN